MGKQIDKEKQDPGTSKIGWFCVGAVVISVGLLLAGAGFTVDHISRTNPKFCATCHNMNHHVESYMDSNHMDHLHQQANVHCKDCHFDYSIKDELQSALHFITGDYEKIPNRIKVEDDMCLECHVSWDHLASATDFLERNPHLSHWPELRCNSCHLSHDDQVDYCSRCHENGGQRMIEDPVIPREHNPFAENQAE